MSLNSYAAHKREKSINYWQIFIQSIIVLLPANDRPVSCLSVRHWPLNIGMFLQLLHYITAVAFEQFFYVREMTGKYFRFYGRSSLYSHVIFLYQFFLLFVCNILFLFSILIYLYIKILNINSVCVHSLFVSCLSLTAQTLLGSDDDNRSYNGVLN